MPAYVQSAQNSGTAGTTLTLTLGTATTAGNCLVVCASGHTGATNNPAVTGITLGGSADHFASAVTAGSLTDESFTYIWADPNCAGGQTSVVITFSSVTTPRYLASVFEFSGLASSSAALVDKSSVSSLGASGTSWSSGSTAATSNANQVWVGVTTTDGVTITGPASPWTNLTQVTQGSDELMSGYQVRSSTGTAAYAGTFSGTGSYNAAVVTLNPPVATPQPVIAPSQAAIQAACW